MPEWKQGELIELEITDVSHSGDGVGRFQERVVFVPNTVTGDHISARLVHLKKDLGYGQTQEILSPSPHRIRPRCLVSDKCGGCQWQHISDDYQKELKVAHIYNTLQKIGGFSQIPISPILSLDSLAYRNKVTYPLERSSTGQVKAGYYRRQTHQIVNLNQCPVQDSRLNPLLTEIKQDIQNRGWSIYQEKRHQGKLRHLSFRIGRHTGEILLTLVSTDANLPNLKEQAETWLKRYPNLVGVAINVNSRQNNLIFGQETSIVVGKGDIKEKFADLDLYLASNTFFQVNTETAEALLQTILPWLNLQGTETLIDAYCGIGTFTLPLAKRLKYAYGIEFHDESIKKAEFNAKINHINNIEFMKGNVEAILPQLAIHPDLILLDPPRKGCHPAVITALRNILPPKLIYISCQPATLARDLKLLCQNECYQLSKVQPADFFPQTPHVECAVLLEKR